MRSRRRLFQTASCNRVSFRVYQPRTSGKDQAESMGFPALAQAAVPEIVIQMAPFLLIGVIFYFLLIRPTQTKQKKLDALITALKNGDRVITNSGIYGVVAGVKDTTFILKIADQVKIEIAKNAIAGLQSIEEPTAPKAH
jgi:preprotein translocase subunit YajC